jgi:hypothetical protein
VISANDQFKLKSEVLFDKILFNENLDGLKFRNTQKSNQVMFNNEVENYLESNYDKAITKKVHNNYFSTIKGKKKN